MISVCFRVVYCGLLALAALLLVLTVGMAVGAADPMAHARVAAGAVFVLLIVSGFGG